MMQASNMADKRLIYLGGSIGSIVGSYLPTLWNASWLDPMSILLGMLGGIAGIIIAYRLSRAMS